MFVGPKVTYSHYKKHFKVGWNFPIKNKVKWTEQNMELISTEAY